MGGEVHELEGTKKGLDRDVAYSEVNLNLNEVYTGNNKNEPTEAPFGEELAGVVKSTGRMYKGLAKSLLFILIGLSPIIIIFVVLDKFVFKKKSAKNSFQNLIHKTSTKLKKNQIKKNNYMK